MLEMYSDHWEKKNGTEPSDMWRNAINSLTDEQLKFGIDECRRRIFNGNPWPPNMANFLAMVHGHSDIDFQGAFWRCLNKKPAGKIEQWVSQNIGYNVRVSSHDNAARLHKRWMMDAIERDSRGELVMPGEKLRALPVHSVKNLNDQKREEYEQRHGTALNPRIAEILKCRGGDV